MKLKWIIHVWDCFAACVQNVSDEVLFDEIAVACSITGSKEYLICDHGRAMLLHRRIIDKILVQILATVMQNNLIRLLGSKWVLAYINFDYFIFITSLTVSRVQQIFQDLGIGNSSGM